MQYQRAENDMTIKGGTTSTNTQIFCLNPSGLNRTCSTSCFPIRLVSHLLVFIQCGSPHWMLACTTKDDTIIKLDLENVLNTIVSKGSKHRSLLHCLGVSNTYYLGNLA